MNHSQAVLVLLGTVWICSFSIAETNVPVRSTAVTTTIKRIDMKPSDTHKTIIDFAARTNADGWQTINDVVMGGLSQSSFYLTTNATAVFSGRVSLENNGGFASVRSPALTMELPGFTGVLLRVKGDGKKYKCSIRIDRAFDGINYQADFVAPKDTWKEIRLPFSSFKPTYRGRILSDRPALDPDKIRTIGFLISDKQEGSFKLELTWIKAYTSLKAPQ
jgi:hypothetical protein